MRLHQDTEGPPCVRMEALLQQVADGSLTGWRRYYALSHAAHCYRCGTFLQRLQVTLTAVRASKEAKSDEDALARLREKIRQIEGQNK